MIGDQKNLRFLLRVWALPCQWSWRVTFSLFDISNFWYFISDWYFNWYLQIEMRDVSFRILLSGKNKKNGCLFEHWDPRTDQRWLPQERFKFLYLNINDVPLTAVSYQLCFYNLINSLLGDFVNYLWNNYNSSWQWRRGLKKAFSSQFIDQSPGLIRLSAGKNLGRGEQTISFCYRKH